MNTGSFLDFPVLGDSVAKLSRTPPSSPTKRRKQENVPDLVIPVQEKQDMCFVMHDDSSEEGTPRTVDKTIGSMDLEHIFEFDTGTLIQLAGEACGKNPDSFWDDVDSVHDQPSLLPINSAEFEAATVHRLRKECEQKDRQIEVLKHTVCELLVWKATHARQLLQMRQQQKSPLVAPTAPTAPTAPPKPDSSFQLPVSKQSQFDTPVAANPVATATSFNQMRADAPEFVSLGIPSLALKKPPLKPVAVQLKPPTLLTPRKRIGAIQSKHGQEPEGTSSTHRDWRIERRANAQGYSANWRDWRDSRNDKGVQKKLKSAW
mmetsp:Transcript_53487/g.143116  ORF Transcript_53487/g.143116 Transcript_53487/m.143116 type:complete len:318 (-) Transcript_53487:251-1204(-)